MSKKQIKLKKKELLKQKKEEKENRKAKAAELSKQAAEKGQEDLKDILLQEEQEIDSMEHRLKKDNQIKIEGLIAIVILLVICVLQAFWQQETRKQLDEAKRVISTLDAQVASLKETETKNAEASAEQQEKIQILSDTLASKNEQLTAYQDAETASFIPSRYPVKGAATIISGGLTDSEIPLDEEIEEADEEQEVVLEPSVIFMVNEGTCITATGSGMVDSVFYDEEGNAELCINHGNGYESIYRCEGNVFVNEGDTISMGSVLMSVFEDETQFDYRIRYENKFIDPKECMIING